MMKDFLDEDRAVRMAFPIDEDHGAARRSKRKKFRRGVSKIIKGAFSHALATKESRNKKTREETTSTPSNHDDDDDMSTKIQKTLKEPTPPPPSPPSPLLSSATVTAESGSSSRYTAISSNPHSNSSSMSSLRSTSARRTSGFDESNSNMMKAKKKCKVTSLNKSCEDYNNNSNRGLYIFLILLVGLVFWGKAFAILCTATCLICFNPRQRRHIDFIDFDFDPADDPS